MGRKEWKYRWTRISNGVKSEEINGLPLDEAASFVPDRGKNNDIHITPKDRRDEQIPEAQPEKEEEQPPVGIFALFRYASICDIILIVIAIVIAILSGMFIPGTMIIFGYLVDKMISFAPNQNGSESNMTSNKSISKEEFLQSASELCLWNTLFGVALFVGSYVFVSFFSLAAANQAFRIRCLFMKAVLKQDMAWYDTHQTGDFATRITGDLTRIQDGLGEKVGICISFISTTLFCTGTGIYYGWKLALVILSFNNDDLTRIQDGLGEKLGICISYISTTLFCTGAGIYYGWKLALVILSLTPLLSAAMAVMSKIQASVSSQELEAYGAAGAVAEEVLSSIRTVVAFSGQKKEIQRYEACLIPASRKGIKRGLLTALGSAITWLCLFGGYALGFWYGVRLIIEDIDKPNPEYTGGTLIIIFFNVLSASMFMGQTAPFLEAFALARGAAAKVFSIIERQPSIDSSLTIGLQPLDVEGHIRLTDVYFNYPSRPTVPVLNGLNLEVKPGETVALVGSSGCGKSTIVQLLLRFYDTNSGSVELDGIDVRDLNLGWLRDHIGLVGQEPVLFSTTIEENIRMGRNEATFDDIVEAAKTANAHNFIEALPMKYQTSVGERGIQLSGGQKQRIAIARALVRNPRILLLDEATSALDTESESVVQVALDEARRGRTTIVVAHRLSTIRTADKIVVLDGGVVKETGTHEELMQAKGIYYNLVVAQTKDDEEETNEIDDADCVSQLERRTSVISVGSDEGQQISTVSQQLSSVTRQASKTSAKRIDEDDEEVDTSTLSQIPLLKLALTDWPYLLIGGISALIMGVYTPVYGIILGDILGVLSEPVEEIESKNLYFCFIFLGMAVTSAVCGFLQIFLFSIAGEKFTLRLRKMVFANLISQDIAFFDDSKNSVGSLCSRLNADASSVQGATGSRISTLLKAISTLGVCIFIGLFYNWKIGLVTLSFVPLVIVAAVLEMQVISGHMHAEKKGMEQASKVATEAIENIRTVASLHQETKFYDQYCNALLNPHRKSRLMSHVRGIAYGFSQGVSAFAYSAAMYYGCFLVANEGLLYSDLIKNVEGIMMGAMMVGQAVAFTPDYEKARVAAVRIFRLLELRPTIDASSVQGMVKPSIEGSVDFSAVQFSYPTRPQIRVLRGLDAAAKPGQTVALVGSSGCGKSTCVQLLERFYDPNKGKVMVDCDDIRDLNLSSHRSHLALVSQEPVLFGRSIAENIAYGDNSRQPDMNEIIEVARQANIHEFVSSLPQGYDTPVGDRGAQLSGGQKQRIAIARALIRNPRILLLDEATSALDAEGEKIVQDALDVARSGRTCLVIAHRLTTIVNADLILVLHRGKIVEKGTHQELINRKGIYYGLHNKQAQNSQ